MVSPDPNLLARMALGDESAFAAFYDRHAARVLGLLHKMLGDPADADDVLQETFLQAWKRAPFFDPQRCSASGWLSVLARSRAVDLLRRRRSPTPNIVLVDEPRAESDPSGSLEKAESKHQVQKALDELPEEQRRAICLAFYNGLTHEQIAQREHLPLGTVKTRIRLGIGRLRGLLNDRLEVSAP